MHVADNTNLNSSDKYAKIRPLLDVVNERFISYSTVFGPDIVSIDESMISYYGRHPCKQFIRGKPIRWGYKAWVAASPLGYAYCIELYQGKFERDIEKLYKDKFGLGGSVILQFLDILELHYPDRKFLLYFDNFFTSITLIEEINKRGHGATGTIRIN